MKSATKLPWHALSLGWVQPKEGEVNMPYDEVRSVEAYTLHAANAYPRLVAELKRLCRDIPKQLGSNIPFDNDLLRELEEE